MPAISTVNMDFEFVRETMEVWEPPSNKTTPA